MAENISKGEFTMKDMRDQFSSVLSMGPLNQVVSMIPGLNANMIPKGREKEGTARIKRFLCMIDSMTEQELNSAEEKPIFTDTRIIRIAKGSGTHPQEVVMLI
jgi:signal recognition particle subunit SRP54